MNRNLYYFFAGLAASAMILTGCGASGSSGGDMKASSVTSDFYAAEAAAAPAAVERGYEADAGSGALSGNGLAAPEITDRKLIRTVDLSVETDAFDALLDQISQEVQALNGYIEQSDISGNSIAMGNADSSRYAYLTIRIPCASLDRFVRTVDESGNITSRSETTEDVTLQYSDLESRKKSLTIEQERIWALLEKADTLEAVIALEERLSEIRYQLESMESQLRLYDNQVDYSTVYVRISEVELYTPTTPQNTFQQIQTGFTKNLKLAGSLISGAFIWLISSSPLWIPLFVVCAVIGFAARRRRRKKSGTPDSSKAAVPNEPQPAQPKPLPPKNPAPAEQAPDSDSPS